MAVTGYIDADGRRRPLGAHAAMLTQTLGRQATSIGTVDAMGEGLVVVEGNSDDDICGPLIGETFPAIGSPQPPFHESCQCLLAPI